MRLSKTPHAGSSGAQLRVYAIGLAWILLLAAAAPHQVVAQSGQPVARNSDPQQVAMARALFEEGLRHVDAAEWSLAADRFGRVLALRYSAVAAYNLALARARLGKSVLALEGLRELLAQPGLEPTVRDAALSLQKEQHATVGWLTVHVNGECAGCRVSLDLKPLPAAALGVAVPVDPGHHAVALIREGEQVATTDLTVARGSRIEANLAAPEQAATRATTFDEPVASEPVPAADSSDVVAPAAPAAALSSSQPSPAGPRKGSLLASPWFWGGVGVLAAGAVTLGVVLAGSGSEAAAPVRGDFSPGVLSGEVRPQ
jgi:hypothetical protein